MIDGPVLVREALAAGLLVEEVFADPSADSEVIDIAAAAGAIVRGVSPEVLSRAVDTVTPNGMAAIARRIDISVDAAIDAAAAGPLVLVLVDVADPGNAGTLLRVAESAGAAAVLFCGSSVDPCNPKCVRASAGALFHLPVASGGDALAILERLGQQEVRTLATVPSGAAAYDTVDLTGPVAIVLGGEAHGLPELVTAAAGTRVTIPMEGRSDSLNVAMAGAVLCFEASRQRRSAAP